MLNSRWQKADCESAHCVEVKIDANAVLLRDTDNVSAVVVCNFKSWDSFLAGAKAGQFDLPSAP